ncbi:hypothetical protein GE061_019934 [Apolygus lucorum]|uniref:tRNA(Phe) (4-demethylwyosine(37)-C(7)) aminocarboxypropyltransferase n=1 Tax=Apolygus lucorum TaxID=248454 RepID=A0A6A4JYF8_APOLU|nr:hypothetical protein GE061_019934 [Apolygus lucorum]
MKNDKRLKSENKLRDPVIKYMMENNLWEEKLKDEIPTKFEKYGGLILFNSPSFSHSRWLDAGEGLYRWDVEKTMFSRGNVTERHRIARLDCTNEVIVDLYAGIGYFTLPYLVHANAKHLHACEWNPDALKSLRFNLSLNGVADRCTVHDGDNRLVCPKNIANRVNLGLIPSSEASWDTACQTLLSSGGTLYVHQNVESKVHSSKHCDDCANLKMISPRSEETGSAAAKLVSRSENDVIVSDSKDLNVSWKKPEWYRFSLHLSHKLLKFVESYHGGNWTVCVTEVFKVKSYAPHVDHIVFSVKCFPSSSLLFV